MLSVSFFGSFFVSYKNIYYFSHYARTNALYCERLFLVLRSDTRNFGKLKFYTLQLSLKRIAVWRLEFGLQSHHFRQKNDSSSRFRLAFFFEKAVVKARISILII